MYSFTGLTYHWIINNYDYTDFILAQVGNTPILNTENMNLIADKTNPLTYICFISDDTVATGKISDYR